MLCHAVLCCAVFTCRASTSPRQKAVYPGPGCKHRIGCTQQTQAAALTQLVMICCCRQ